MLCIQEKWTWCVDVVRAHMSLYVAHTKYRWCDSALENTNSAYVEIPFAKDTIFPKYVNTSTSLHYCILLNKIWVDMYKYRSQHRADRHLPSSSSSTRSSFIFDSPVPIVAKARCGVSKLPANRGL